MLLRSLAKLKLLSCLPARASRWTPHLLLGVRSGERLLVADGAGKGGAPALQPDARQVLIALPRQSLQGV